MTAIADGVPLAVLSRRRLWQPINRMLVRMGEEARGE
jgi:hypothetical protein